MSGKLPVGSWQLAVLGQVAGNRQLTTGTRRSGFTLVEIMVAIAVATILFGICTAIFVKVSQYKARSEKLLFMAEEANGALGRIARDIQGLYVGGPNLNDYWLQNNPVGCVGEGLTILAATENPGQADWCTVSYYVKGTTETINGKPWIRDGKLYRKLSGGVQPLSGPWSLNDPDWLLAEGLIGITFSTDPVGFATNGKVPRSVTVTMKMADPDGKLGMDGKSQAYLLFTKTVCPGSEENQ